jgi:hypothetical protein
MNIFQGYSYSNNFCVKIDPPYSATLMKMILYFLSVIFKFVKMAREACLTSCGGLRELPRPTQLAVIAWPVNKDSQ